MFGTGASNGKRPPTPNASWSIYCVRGPITEATLRLPAELAITDPAALVATLDIPTLSAGRKPAFIPHHVSVPLADWKAICDAIPLRYIGPQWGVDRLIAELRATSLLITEAMHGAILADALRIPWIPTVCGDQVLALKWIEWCRPLHLTYRPWPVPVLWNVESNLGVVTQGSRLIQRAMMRAGFKGSREIAPMDLPPALADAVRETLEGLMKNAEPTLSAAADFDRAVRGSRKPWPG